MILYTVVVWAPVLISAFIDNIPYTATMLPVVTGLVSTLGIDPMSALQRCCPQDLSSPWWGIPRIWIRSAFIAMSWKGTHSSR